MCGGVKVLPLFSGFSCKVYLHVSPRFYFRRHTFCFLLLVTILESQELTFEEGSSLAETYRQREPSLQKAQA
jgi:hypothetical protein